MIQKSHLCRILFILFGLFLLSRSWCFESEFGLQTGEKVKCIDYSPDGTMMVVATDTSRVYVYNTNNYLLIGTYVWNGRKSQTAKFSKNGVMIGIGYDHDDLRIIYTANLTLMITINTGLDQVQEVDFNEGSTKIVACGKSTTIKAFSLPSGSLIILSTDTTSNADQIQTCKFGRTDDRIGYGAKGGHYIVVLTASSNTSKSTSKDQGDQIECIDFLSNNSLIEANKDNKGMIVTGNTSTIIITPPQDVISCASSRANDTYALGTKDTDNKIYIFNYSNIVVESIQYEDDVNAIRFSYDGNRLAVGLDTGRIYTYLRTCQKSCQTSYYYNSTTSTCVSCPTSLVGCSDCLNSTLCVGCAQGFYLNISTAKCQYCNYSSGCGSCVNQSTCNYCLQGYFLNSTVCRTCDSIISGCLYCNATTGTIVVSCSACQNSYYLNSTGKCQSCSSIPNCLLCRNSTTLTCLQCKMGYYELSNACTVCSSGCLVCTNGTFCTNCLGGYYANSTGSCITCSSRCQICNSTGYCLNCFSGFYQSLGNCTNCVLPCLSCSSSTYCKSCVSGYYSLGNGTCSLCSNGCVSCSSATLCTSCGLGAYLHTNSSCLSCSNLVTSCARCSNTSCIICNMGFYLNGTTCSSCSIMFGCSTCTTSTNCLTCMPGTYKTALTGNSSCSLCSIGCSTCFNSTACYSCTPGYYLNVDSCTRCPFKCQLCSSAIACSSCIIGYFLNGVSCSQCSMNITGCSDCLNDTYCMSCMEGYFTNTNKTCTVCSSPCVTCTSSSACKSCQLGYYLSGTSCLICNGSCSQCSAAANCSSCIPGYYLSSVTCLQCTNNCLTCNTSTVCFSCKTGYYVNSTSSCASCSSNISNCLDCSSGTTCLQCSYGYVVSSFGGTSCDKCSTILGCLHCSNSTACQVCQNGLFLQTNLTCSNCPSGCATCNGTACFTCYSSFILSNTTCQLCQASLEGCQMCLNSTACVDCLPGYYLATTTCTSCRTAMRGCFLCNTSAICTSCQEGYYLNTSTNNCDLCSVMVGCQLCRSSTVCIDCESGFYLNTNTCSLCTSAIPGCLSCLNVSSCSDCASGYYLNTSLTCLTCSSQMIGCIFCNSSSACLQCQSGYYLHSNNTCVVCNSVGCEVCSPSNSSNCITCNSRYYKSGVSCLSCGTPLQGCIECSASSLCTLCDAGYFLNGTVCTLCSSALQGCGKCSSGSVCLECKSTYFLNGSSTCISCSSSLQGCLNCLNSTTCLACSSSFFKNGSICSPCTNINGCIFCQNMTSCLLCSSEYYLFNSTCNLCSVMTGCYSCLSSTICTVCSGGYTLGSGLCSVTALQPATSSYTSFKLKSYYIDSTNLKHVLFLIQKYYNQVQLNWTSVTQLNIVSINGTTTPLTIKKVQYGSNGYSLIFWTDNPLILKPTPMVFSRLLLEDELNIDAKVSLDMTEGAITQIVPSEGAAGDLSMDYDLSQPQFYASYVSTLSWEPLMYFGICVIILVVLNHTIRFLTLEKAKYFGDIIPHILSVKCVGFALYPLKKQMISYCQGFMVLDFPWLNYYFSQLLSNSSDSTPKPIVIFYNNMNLASTFLLAIIFIVFLWLLFNFIIKYFSSDRKSQGINQLMWNIFGFGIICASCLSLQGAILNPIDTLTVNAAFYILGIVLYIFAASYSFYSLFLNRLNFPKFRIFMKATLLSLLHFNPIYVISGVMILEIACIAYEFFQLKDDKQHPIITVVSQVLCNVAIMVLIFSPSLLSSILICSLLLSIVFGFEIFVHCSERSSRLVIKSQKNNSTMGFYEETQDHQEKHIWNVEFDKPDMKGTKATFDPENSVYEPVRKRNKRLKHTKDVSNPNKLYVNEKIQRPEDMGMDDVRQDSFIPNDFM